MGRCVCGTLLVVMVAAGCAGPDREDDALAADTVAPAVLPESAIANMAQSAARDPDHQFLRRMSDHHQGLIVMAERVMNRGSTAAVQSDAGRLHLKRVAERDSMLELIGRTYQEQHHPIVTAKNQAQADTLASAAGTEYDRTFYRMVIDHHRDGIALIEEQLPRLRAERLRALAERMKADMERALVELEAKARG